MVRYQAVLFHQTILDSQCDLWVLHSQCPPAVQVSQCLLKLLVVLVDHLILDYQGYQEDPVILPYPVDPGVQTPLYYLEVLGDQLNLLDLPDQTGH